MFSSPVLKNIAKYVKFFELTKLFPISWDVKSNMLAISNSKVVFPFLTVFLTHHVLYFVYTYYQFFHAVVDKNLGVHVMDIFWLGFMPSTYYLNFEAMLGIYLRRNEMVTLFRWMVGFDKELIRKFVLLEIWY